MKPSRRKFEELLAITGLHDSVRHLFRATAGRRAEGKRRALTRFYGALLPKEALVFDIGANVGMLAEVFCTVGATVVAVEPNADCVRHIQLSYANLPIQALQMVAGSRNGVATIHMSDERDDMSSLSDDWIATMRKRHGEFARLWARDVTVPMLTLDALVEHYGTPYFIKIDVEGAEESVLDGLSVQPPLLSFEFNGARPDDAAACLGHRVIGPDSLFNVALEDPVEFELDSWVDRNAMKSALAEFTGTDIYGDVFVTGGRRINLGRPHE
jgi:FkbM family methyltransferase